MNSSVAQAHCNYDDAGMRKHLACLVSDALKSAQDAGDLQHFEYGDLGIERTSDARNGDWTSTFAMRCAKAAKRPPRDVASAILKHFPQDEYIDKVEVAGPGFLNFTLTNNAKVAVFSQVVSEGEQFGRSNNGEGKRINVEFVSANPVGPMHIGHGRWAALGDSLCRVLEFSGWDVTREFYINDAGSQMDVFARSIDKRYRQIKQLITEGKTPEESANILDNDRIAALDDPEGLCPEKYPYTCDFAGELGKDSYGGAYIIDIAREFIESGEMQTFEDNDAIRVHEFRERGYAKMLQNIKDVLHACGCDFDVWFSERDLHAAGPDGSTAITKAFKKLDDAGYLYKEDGALWFRSTDFGDDKNRVLVKSDGSYTYFSADIAYHAHKFGRGFDRCIDLWGADHHGYVARMQAAVSAFGHKGQLDVLLGQLVNLLRGGVPVRMSKRKGTMVTFEELLEDVGRDATRFILLSRSSDQEIDFDIEKAKEESSDNPVYYVQYAHARICSILRKVAETDSITYESIDELASKVIGDKVNLNLLGEPSELALARMIGGFGELVSGAARDMAPHRLTYYATDLASAFHAFYTSCHVLTKDPELTKARLLICDATRRVLALTLNLIGVSAPSQMEHREEDK